MRVPNPHLHDCHEHMAFRLSHGDESILRTLNAGGSLKAWRLYPSIPWRFELREHDTHRMRDLTEKEVGYLARRGFIHGRVLDADSMAYTITDAGQKALETP